MCCPDLRKLRGPQGHEGNAIAFLHQLISGWRRTLPGSTGKSQASRSAVVSRRVLTQPTPQADTPHLAWSHKFCSFWQHGLIRSGALVFMRKSLSQAAAGA